MAYKAYLIQKFENTHENMFFREFSNKLKEVYENTDGLHVLIGNLSCGGHQLDAIFIRSGQISVIDFKNYGGSLTFSENNPWLIRNENGQQLFVSGGGQIRNPYQQVKAYRRTLFEFLSNRANEILTPMHENVKWDHTGCVILFQRKIKYNPAEISEVIKKYFSITDFNTIFNLLSDKNSQYLNFNDIEISNIVRVLDVTDENLYDEKIIDVDVNVENPAQESNLSLIKELIPQNLPQEDIKKILLYYQILINLERRKEPEISSLYSYPCAPQPDMNNYILDLSVNTDFFNLFLRDQDPDITRFPKKYLFISKKVSIENQSLPFFYIDIQISNSVIQNQIEINFRDFKIYLKTLEKLGVENDLIDELTTLCDSADTLNEKLNIVRNLLFENALLENNIYIGFSSDTFYSAQLYSELKKLEKLSISKESYLYNFLLNEKIDISRDDLLLNKFIKVTELNLNQEKAVKSVFENSFSVITGPPGTGKTQVIINILANAIINNHKVLFASKNNKAVDNVTDRYKKIINENDFILRYGPFDFVNNITKPKIQSFIDKASNNNFSFNNNNWDITENKIEKLCEIKNILSGIDIAYSKLSDEEKKLFVEDNLDIVLDNNIYNSLLKSLKYYSKNIFTKAIFYIFRKNKIISEIEKLNVNQNSLIYNYISEIKPYIDKDKSLLISAKDNLIFIRELKDKVYEYRELSKKRIELISFLNLDENNLNYSINSKHIKESVELLNMKIQQKLIEMSVPDIINYKNRLPANDIWQIAAINSFYNDSIKFLEIFNVAAVTSLSIKNSFPLHEDLFDLLIIDEASQCDIASVLPLLFRAKRIAVIGDPLQLPHISIIEEYEEKYLIKELDLSGYFLDYKNKSLYDYCFDLALKSGFDTVFLNEHFRSYEEIIKFSSSNFYERILGQSLLVKTNAENYIYEPLGINWLNVEGELIPGRNINRLEIDKTIAKARSLRRVYPAASIGIITPFTHQKERIVAMLSPSEVNFFIPDTVHKYQGDERDIIIYSLVVTNGMNSGAVSFVNYINKNINKPNLLNVAITRARSSLIIVGNHNYCKSLNHPVKTPLCLLAEYTESLGKVIRN